MQNSAPPPIAPGNNTNPFLTSGSFTTSSDSRVVGTNLFSKKLGRSFLPLKRSCWLGLSEYQVRDKISLYRHWILVLTAYTFILWHQLTGGRGRRWANKELKTFVDALQAFRTAISYRFVKWLNHNKDVFAAHVQSLGFIWA